MVTIEPSRHSTHRDSVARRGRTCAEAECKRRRLIRAARDTFVRKGYAATTLTEIATEIGMTRPGIYYYFPTKLDLFDAVFDNAEAVVLGRCLVAARAGETADEQLRLLFAEIARCGAEKCSDVAFLVTAAVDSRRRPELLAHVYPRMAGLRAMLSSPLFVAASPIEAADDDTGTVVEVMMSILWGWALVQG